MAEGGNRAFEPALADVTPRAHDVRPDLHIHGRNNLRGDGVIPSQTAPRERVTPGCWEGTQNEPIWTVRDLPDLDLASTSNGGSGAARSPCREVFADRDDSTPMLTGSGGAVPCLLPRRFRCSGRERPFAPGRLATDDLG
jgi:hypothetical protein